MLKYPHGRVHSAPLQSAEYFGALHSIIFSVKSFVSASMCPRVCVCVCIVSAFPLRQRVARSRISR